MPYRYYEQECGGYRAVVTVATGNRVSAVRQKLATSDLQRRVDAVYTWQSYARTVPRGNMVLAYVLWEYFTPNTYT